MARARRKVDLVNVFGLDADILEMPKAEYRWRTFIDRKDLHELYSEFWGMHPGYGTNDPALRTGDRGRKGDRTTDRISHLAWGPGDLSNYPKSLKCDVEAVR